jgi:hypothetical protein
VTVLSAGAPSLDLRRQFGDLLASGDWADVTLDVDDESIYCNRTDQLYEIK